MQRPISASIFPWRWLLLAIISRLVGFPAAFAQLAQAPVEVRVPQAPQPVVGSDGRVHVAYELHVSNFYQSTGTLHLKQVSVLAHASSVVLAQFTAGQVSTLLAHPRSETDTLGVPIEAGQRVVLFLWLALPSGQPPRELRHRLVFETTAGGRQLVDGVLTPVNNAAPVVLGAPLRAGPWLVHEGPGSHSSHHWGSIVAVNGQATIPQRYAIDFFGLTPTWHAVRVPRNQLPASTNADWVGFGAEVLAVANGVVRDVRDGVPNQPPFATLPAPTDLTTRTLMGNFVVLEIAPHVFVHYAHLQPGSVAVKLGDRIQRGTVLGRLGQSGNTNAPHLHLQVSTAVTFEASEGVPFTFRKFDRVGAAQIGEVLDQATTLSSGKNTPQPCRQQLPLDGNIIIFK